MQNHQTFTARSTILKQACSSAGCGHRISQCDKTSNKGPAMRVSTLEVHVPTSTKPNPMPSSPSTPTASLSNPAASPASSNTFTADHI